MAVPAFHEQRFPEFITAGVVFGPRARTTKVKYATGKEQRTQEWEDLLIRGDVAKAIQTDAEYDTVLNFFREQRGDFHGFRVKDWGDYTLFQEPTNPSTGDGFITTFQIVRTYSTSEPPENAAIRPQQREIIKIRGGTGDPINTPDSPGTVVRVNGVNQTVVFSSPPGPSEVYLDVNTGILEFGTPPSNGLAVDFTGEFDIPMRFDIDELPATYDDFNITSVRALPVVELNLL